MLLGRVCNGKCPSLQMGGGRCRKDAEIPSCYICGKEIHGINRRQKLKYHLMTHTNERPHSCPYCQYRAHHKFTLYRHVRSVHRNLVGSRSGSEQGVKPRGSSVEGGQQPSNFSITIPQGATVSYPCSGQGIKSGGSSAAGSELQPSNFSVTSPHSATVSYPSSSNNSA